MKEKELKLKKRLYQKSWRIKHKGHILEYQRQYRIDHKEELEQYGREYSFSCGRGNHRRIEVNEPVDWFIRKNKRKFNEGQRLDY